HSQGTVISGLLAQTDRPSRVHTVASLAPLWRGTGGSVADQMLTASSGGERDALESGAGPLPQIFPGSLLLQEMWAGGTPYAPGGRYLIVAARDDEGRLLCTSRSVTALLAHH